MMKGKQGSKGLAFLPTFLGGVNFAKRKLAWPFLSLVCLLFLGACQRQPGASAASAGEGAVPAASASAPAPADPMVVEGIHTPTGLIADAGYLLVRNNCGSCHSFELIRNKRATREGWLSTIRWMQRTQNLWNLGENEKPILDYLAKNYAPEDTGRRKQLTGIEWYKLEQ
jgi:hypothetical protein